MDTTAIGATNPAFKISLRIFVIKESTIYPYMDYNWVHQDILLSAPSLTNQS
tara:strand:+ start:223 stop:378 length:156 start_codon:yes stop_codon:yes gene_type:complete